MNILPNLVRYGSIALAVFGVWQMTQVMDIIRAQETPIAPPPVAPPQKPFAKGVAATGILESVDENVSIGPPAPALTTEVLVKVWQKVKKGVALLQLDDRELQAQLINHGLQFAGIDQVEYQVEKGIAERADPEISPDPQPPLEEPAGAKNSGKRTRQEGEDKQPCGHLATGMEKIHRQHRTARQVSQHEQPRQCEGNQERWFQQAALHGCAHRRTRL